MAASNTDRFKKSKRKFETTVGIGGILAGGTTLPLTSVTGLDTTTAVTLVVGAGTATEEVITGVVSGSNLINCVRGKEGTTDSAHSAGETVNMFFTETHWDDAMDGILVEHDQDGTHGAVTASSVTVASGKITTSAASKLEDYSVPLSTYRADTTFDHVISGGVWTGDAYGSTLNASMTAMVCMINGRRISISAVTARAFTASKDTYVDILDNANGTGTVVYTEATNNAASPALAANSIRIGIIVTGASSIASVASINQGQETKVLPIASSIPYTTTDSLGNLICPRDPNRKIIGYRQITTSFSTASVTAVQVTGLSCPVIVPTGRKIRISVYAESVNNGTATNFSVVSVWDGTVASGTQLQIANWQSSANSQRFTAFTSVMVSPGSASKTYNVGFATGSAGTAVFGLGSGATSPAYILVELV